MNSKKLAQIPVTEEEAFKILDKCPHCGGKVVPIVYGDPTPEVMDAAEHGKVILGGCCIALDSPDYACAVCGQRFKKEI